MRRFIIFFALVVISPLLARAQELDATITVNTEQLASGERGRVENFGKQIGDYLNNTKFTRQAWDGPKIKCSFNVVFQSSSDEVTYIAQLVVTSQRPVYGSQNASKMMFILDSSWQFRYEKNQGIYFNQTDFDPLISFLDYYAYVIIGFDTDSYYKLGGTDYFQKALDICIRGGNSSYSKGWQFESTAFNRRGLIDNLLNSNYQLFRQDYFDYHYNGIDLLQTPENRQSALENITKLVKNLDKMKDQVDSRSVLLRVFFDAKFGELIDCLKYYPDKNIFQMLKKLDAPHLSKYDEAAK